MSQKLPEDRRGFPLLLSATIASFAITVTVVACDRPDAHAVIPAPETYAQRNASTTPVQRADFDNTSAGASTAPRYSSSAALSDTVISGKIKAAILTDPGMSGADVSVNTDHGVVTLTGRVKSQEQTAIASAHAQREDGVMRVDNLLSLTPQ